MNKSIEVSFDINDEGSVKAHFYYWLPYAQQRRCEKNLSIFQRYRKHKIDPRMIEAYIRYLLLKKVITPEVLHHQNMSHLKLMIVKNLKLIENDEAEKKNSLNKNREVFREFITKYAEEGVGGFIKKEESKKGVIPSTTSVDVDIGSGDPNDVSVWPRGGLLEVDPKSAKSTLILGASFSGKTYLLVKELNKLYPGDYDAIILFTESINAESLKDINPKLCVKIVQGFKPKIVDFLKKVNDLTNNRYRILIILDDVVTEKESKTLNKMVLTYRNAGISTCILIQYPNLISKSSRSSFHQVAITGGKSVEWWQAVCSVFDLCSWAKLNLGDPSRKSRIPKEEIFQLLKKATNEPGEILYLDLRRGREPLLYDLS